MRNISKERKEERRERRDEGNGVVEVEENKEPGTNMSQTHNTIQ
jgi:hypothetical protein